jgi:hypothetical protein
MSWIERALANAWEKIRGMMAYFEDDYLDGIYFGRRVILFAKTNGRPILLKGYHVSRYLSTGEWIKRPQDSENPDRLMIRDEFAKCMEKATRRVVFIGHIRTIKSFKDASRMFHNTWAKIMKRRWGVTPGEYNEAMSEFT